MDVPREFNGARVTVMGLGRFGGGAGVTRWLVEQGASVLLTDLADETSLAGPLESIDDLVQGGSVTLRLGAHDHADFTNADYVIANPAVPKPWLNPHLLAARDAGVPVTTEIRLLVDRLPNWYRTIGITGTTGKSTTSAMVAHLIRQLGGIAWLGGNIGGSLLPELPRIGVRDHVVLELSSAQLWWLSDETRFGDAKAWTPASAAVTNLSPNHEDWHGDLAHYYRSKARILSGTTRSSWRDSIAVLGPTVGDDVSVPPHYGVHRVEPDANDFLRTAIEQIESKGGLSTPGAHNITNALAAILLVSELPARDPIGGDATEVVPDIELEPARETGHGASLAGGASNVLALAEQAGDALARAFADEIVSFKGLPHRLEFVGEFNGVRAYNDSKCTTPKGVVMALRAIEETVGIEPARVRLICGGYDKGTDLSPMYDSLNECAEVCAIGQTSAEICAGVPKAWASTSLDEAVRALLGAAMPGEVILLSPGCASWDQFSNYEERGELFRDLVVALGG